MSQSYLSNDERIRENSWISLYVGLGLTVGTSNNLIRGKDYQLIRDKVFQPGITKED
jgi:hypothetical protein